MYWEDLFATTYNYELIPVDLTIMQDSEEVEEEIRKNSISMTEIKEVTEEEIDASEDDDEESAGHKYNFGF